MVNIGKPLTILSSINSTNIYAMQEISDGLATNGKAYFTFEQTAGKGQRGKKWESEVGQNIMVSIVIKPENLTIQDIFFGNAAVAIACYDFFSALAGDETSIKWPNDIYWRDRKAGGILIENVFSGQTWKHSVIGIGININQVKFDPNLPNPVSLLQITGKTFDLLELLNPLFQAIQSRWNQLYTGKPAVLALYNEKLYKKDKKITITKNNCVTTATLKGVNANGQLEVFSLLNEYLSHGEAEVSYEI
jgi:BirA family biotin operon repressor/biotin-[acetyl-CoA-carboxylase] ligase